MSPALAKLLHARRSAQHLVGAQADDPHAAVRRLLAVQAQDYGAALWAVGLRTRAADAATVESAIAAGRIVRTWPMRGTLHFVAAEDVRWLQSLLAPRALARDSARHEREYGLDAKVLATCRRVLERALRDGGPVSRPALYEALETAGIATGNSRGLHILYRLATEGLICQGPRLGRQPGFVWQEAWLAAASAMPRDAALAELGRRYLLGHGPATAHDLAWWSGLTLKDSQAALQAADAVPVEFDAGGARYWRLEDGPDGSSPTRRDVLLLPAFDEYLLGYKDRTPVLDADHHRKVFTINGIIQPCVIAGSRVAGTWPRTVAGDFEPALFRPLGEAETRGLRAAAKRHAGFWSVS
ncbi:winged helix DNA-binding domain-containing protein [Marilutibacter chinensis]|uniref:Winged helix DNA-binding domain-containing protein n=1 Tax=Marilutibacter chinensis TaxID=2912247 RepID=A0ABS9HTR1_9GAMM|nr:winged helix DNA-binding domain-containing protein [Lysobacter chinensis]MCF7221742.1 winged helix DNA-binding domain-containing protein [Lysobacter chinensis]